LINLLCGESHIQSAGNLSDRSLEDIGLAPHGQDFFDAVKPFWEPQAEAEREIAPPQEAQLALRTSLLDFRDG
jgi:hypothetical protein